MVGVKEGLIGYNQVYLPSSNVFLINNGGFVIRLNYSFSTR